MLKSKKIRVEFIDVVTGDPIGYDEKKAKNLPETFEFATQVEIGGLKYEVVKAEPTQRKLYRKTGLLQVELREIVPAPVSESVSLHDSTAEGEWQEELPAVNGFPVVSRADLFPAFTTDRAGKDLAELSIHGWRSLELLRDGLHKEVLVEFSRIETAREEFRIPGSEPELFRKQLRRSGVVDPFEGAALSLSKLQSEYFPFAMRLDGLTFAGADGYADSSFALKTAGGLVIYGLEIRDKVACMGILRPEEVQVSLLKPDLGRLRRFMEELGLVLVDWTELLVFEPDAEDLEQHLGLPGEPEADWVEAGEEPEEAAVEIPPLDPVQAASLPAEDLMGEEDAGEESSEAAN